jgi:hypothetical protein
MDQLRLLHLYESLKNIRTFTNCICSRNTSSWGPGSNPGLVMWDFVMDKSGVGAGFLRELRFLLPIYYIPSASPQSSSLSPEAGTIGEEWPQCQ